jgi:hypothetical protein
MRAISSIDEILRATSAARIYAGAGSALRVFIIAILAGSLYGAVMGGFDFRSVQMAISATKVPILLAVTFLISLPSFFVFNTLLGLRSDFGMTLSALVTAQATLTLTLASLAPLTILCYCSTSDYYFAVLFNGAAFAVAAMAGQITLARLYRRLIALDPRHRVMLRIWIVTYCFVAIQMAWVLRPFVGNPLVQPRFFRHDAWSNAYVFVGRLLWSAVNR